MILNYDPKKADEYFFPSEPPQEKDIQLKEDIQDYMGNMQYDAWKENQ